MGELLLVKNFAKTRRTYSRTRSKSAQVLNQMVSSDLAVQQEPTSLAALYSGGTVVILIGVGIAAFYLYTQRKKPLLAPAACKNDIFRMN